MRRALPLLWLLPVTALARVGGGEGFSTGGGGWSGGGGGGFGGGGGDGMADLGPLLWWLLVEHPALGWPLVLAVVGFMLYAQMHPVPRRSQPWTIDHPAGSPAAAHPATAQRGLAKAGLVRLAQEDTALSVPVLLDFVQLVVRRAWEAGDARAWEALTPFVQEDVRRRLTEARGPGVVVRDVVLASLGVVAYRREGAHDVIDVDVSASRTVEAQGNARAVYVEETWTFRRAVGARSLSPEATHRLGCPACGSAAACDTMGRCRACGTPIAAGQLQWQASAWSARVERPIEAPQVGPSTGGTEPGWHVPSVVAPDLAAQGRAFRGRHPDHDDDALDARLRGVFLALQAAWDEGRWDKARPYTTDAAWNTLRFWMERYARHGLRNRVADVRVLGLQIVKLGVDAWYESLTVRVRAVCRDWTEEVGTGRVVGGNPNAERRFSEYWTFLRAVGAPAPKGDGHACPSCGAPLDRIEATGACAACGSIVTLGTHDWVLSRIEQPEVYQP